MFLPPERDFLSPAVDHRDFLEYHVELNKLQTTAVVTNPPHIVVQPNLHAHPVNLSRNPRRQVRRVGGEGVSH